MQLLCVLSLVALFVICDGGDIVARTSNLLGGEFQVKKGLKIDDKHVIEAEQVPNIGIWEKCAIKCLSITTCKSFNFRRTDKGNVCQPSEVEAHLPSNADKITEQPSGEDYELWYLAPLTN